MTRTNVLNTATINYLELIGNGKTYRVPPYQRDYAWTEDAWEDFWNDVLDLRRQTEGRHYMGALVVQGQTDREFTIIDGQQRLATLSILSLAVVEWSAYSRFFCRSSSLRQSSYSLTSHPKPDAFDRGPPVRMRSS